MSDGIPEFDAAKKLPESFLKKNSDIAWNTIIATRNWLIHGYDTIDNKILWVIIQDNIPKLKVQLKKLVSEL